MSDTLTIQVQDALGITASALFTIPIAGGTPPTITTSSPLPNATQSSAYSTTLAATSGTPPYVWSKVSQTGANTFSVSASGVVTGTPGTIETDTLTVKVTDNLGLTATKSFSLQTVAASGLNGGGSHLVVNFPSGFASAGGALRAAWESSVTGGQMVVPQITPAHKAGAVWYTTQVNITSFTTSFNFTMTNAGFSVVPAQTFCSTNGITFCVQNSNTTTNGGSGLPFGTNATADANICGFGSFTTNEPGAAPGNSIAIKFDCSSYGAQAYPGGVGFPSSVGLYIYGGPEGGLGACQDLTQYGINFYNDHSYDCTVTYDGAILTLVIQDTTTNAAGRFTWPINIPAAMGTEGVSGGSSNLAYVGFTGGQVYSAAQLTAGDSHTINSWEFSDGSAGTFTRLAAPTFGVTPGSYSSTQSVSLSGPVGASIYYTTGGLLPTNQSTLYTGTPISVSASTVINAVAIQSGFTDSYVAIGNYVISSSGRTINLGSGFASASSLIRPVGYSYFSGSNLVLTDATGTGGPFAGPGFAVGAAWYVAPVSIATFATTIGLAFTSPRNGSPLGVGMTFCIQNQTPAASSYPKYSLVNGGPLSLGNVDKSFGYGPPVTTGGGPQGSFPNSVAVSFNLTNNSIGMYTDGAAPSGSDTALSGITLVAGHLLTAAFSYNGTTLQLILTDTVTTNSQTFSWTIDIPTTVGGSTAWVGFTAATGNDWANQEISSWVM